MHACCYKIQVPSDTFDKIYIPFNARNIEFTIRSTDSLSSLADRTPTSNIISFINDMNNILAYDRRTAKKAMFSIVVEIVILILSVALTVVFAALFYLLLSLFSLFLIGWNIKTQMNILRRLTPRIATILDSRGRGFRSIGLEFTLGQIAGKPSWIELNVKSYEGNSIMEANLSGFPMLVANPSEFLDQTAQRGIVVQDMPTRFVPQRATYPVEMGQPTIQPNFYMPQQQQQTTNRRFY